MMDEVTPAPAPPQGGVLTKSITKFAKWKTSASWSRSSKMVNEPPSTTNLADHAAQPTLLGAGSVEPSRANAAQYDLGPFRLSLNQEQPTPSVNTRDVTLQNENQAILASSESQAWISQDAGSLLSSDSASMLSHDSTSVFSASQSVYSSFESRHSLDQDDPLYGERASSLGYQESVVTPGDHSARPAQQRRAKAGTVKAPRTLEGMVREFNMLAKKAALFKNSKLPPIIPAFSTTLPMWSMICRAVKASQECYDSHISVRSGVYFAADATNNTKAMIIDDQMMDDGSRLVVVAIRGTKVESVTDWVVNGDAKPASPYEFLDDDTNTCHAGFLQIAKAMTGILAARLKPYTVGRPRLLLTGHSAGAAVASLLYSHMLSQKASSALTCLASRFSNIDCMVFGCPPLSLVPMPKLVHGRGVFWSFANEGDPVVRLSTPAYVTSLVKLLTAPGSVAELRPVKIVRTTRGSAVVKQVAAVELPWEQRPSWPVPVQPFAVPGDIVLLRDDDSKKGTASCLAATDLDNTIFGDLAQHTPEMYLRRVEDAALRALTGRTSIS